MQSLAWCPNGVVSGCTALAWKVVAQYVVVAPVKDPNYVMKI